MISRRVSYELSKRAVGPFLLALERWRKAAKRRGRPARSRHPFGPPMESLRKLQELMTMHYLTGRYADGAVPVAWVTSGFPVELLRPLGFHTVYPENHAALCGAQHKTVELAGRAEQEGYARDLCSYARTDIGSVLSASTPVGRLPKPDLLCCCTNICQTVLYWYRELAAHFRVPLIVIDTPFIYGKPAPHAIEYVADQLEEAIGTAERVTGRKADRERLASIARLARDASVRWGECLAVSRARPAPWTGFDTFFHIAPIVTLRGEPECIAYYDMLKDELTDRVKSGIGGIEDERHRLLWDNLPMWFNIRHLATTFAERGFNFVCATYSNAWAEAGELVDPADPLGSSALAYSSVYLNRDLANRLQVMKQLARDFGTDGAVLHSDRSCKPYSVGQIDVKERLAAELGIRVLILEADHNDPRAYSSEQGDNRLAAFMESFG